MLLKGEMIEENIFMPTGIWKRPKMAININKIKNILKEPLDVRYSNILNLLYNLFFI